MKINELILRLERIRKEKGNLSVAGTEKLMFSPAGRFAEIFPFAKEEVQHDVPL